MNYQMLLLEIQDEIINGIIDVAVDYFAALSFPFDIPIATLI